MNFINIAFSGSQAAQAQLNTTAMNTANAYTKGYSRQRVELSAIGPMSGSRLSAGDGVSVTSIRRISDQYLVNQVWQASSQNSYFGVSQQYFSGLEAAIGSESTNIGTGMDKFFATLNEATTQPDSRALRQQIINEANALATRFNNINNTMNSQKSAIQNQRSATVSSINTLSSNIASLNKKISELESSGANTGVLRDERDEMIRQLSELSEVRVSEAADGSFTVTFKNGQPLVSGQTAATLAVKAEPNGDQTLELNFSGTVFGLDMATGGQLGALYDYESGQLKEMQEIVHGMAESLANAFNDQLALGFDLNNQAGKPLFVFDPTNPNGILQVSDISADELALSSAVNEPGNGGNLQSLIDIKGQAMKLPHLGDMSLNDASAAIVSDIGIASRQNQVEAKAAAKVLHETQLQRDSVSAVNPDEEAVNLLMYTQAYKSNLKVISTGDELFAAVLSMF
jgi:flagellar hook-associated protein 1 FlgK